MSHFRAKRLDLGGFINARIIRDHTKRKVFEQFEPERQALRYAIRNTSLPQRVRVQAQLQLSQMHAYTRSTQIKNRCVAGGVARSVFRDFKIARYQFREQALAGLLPGVRKASCHLILTSVLSLVLLTERMLVYQEKDLPKDPVFVPDLEKLGYFINDKDQIRQVANPEADFKFKLTNNERWNDVHGNAMNECIRRIVLERLSALSLSTVRLPPGVQEGDKHVPILCSSNLRQAKRVVVVFGSSTQDLGIWAYRSIGKLSINGGSMVDFAKTVLKKDGDELSENDEDTALVIANAGQLYYHWGSGTAVSYRTWFALPQQSAVHPPLKWSLRNRIPQNANCEEHVKCVFEGILAARGQLVHEEAKIDVIAVSDGAQHATRYLAANWEKWKDYIAAMCLADPIHNKSELVNEGKEIDMDVGLEMGSFSRFLSTRCRAYILSPHPAEWPVPGTLDYGCNTFSSGEPVHSEASIVSCWRSMLQWLDKLHADPSYEEVELIIAEEEDDDGWEKRKQQGEAEAEAEVVVDEGETGS
ncbi:uncharacterized protein TRUGW13939_03636 [Talaromyces rugulosus]|uniref:Arb2 domain-containing protein n=1 Tax=Talaromyces rugulosus TaxID=121627 RepID=A0A7H8QSR0_TALRU|nr:uncharacterized protein TRUGW13939_03636 [Talaromyces rugulosus]QKX56531.1 hypothetical protein TRUGW13939_03636 [Talaromyces rugulosus]